MNTLVNWLHRRIHRGQPSRYVATERRPSGQRGNPQRGTAREPPAGAMWLPVLFLALNVPAAFAQHVANPFAGATVYLNPDYTKEVNSAIATVPAGSALANQMSVVATYPTAVWLDRMAAIAGGTANNGRMGLQQHIQAALAQQKGTQPIVVELVIYDLPDRDCAALASNGEISIAPNPPTQPLSGIQTYEQNYITPIFNILASFSTNPNIRFVLVIEDDSLPNMITNTGLSFSLPNCIAANDGQSYPTLSMNGVYVQGIQYALNQFHSLPNAYNYLDVGHHGWLGWPANLTAAVPFFLQVAQGTTAGVSSVDGFITNTANYGPTKEPYMTATETISGTPVFNSAFYQFNPNIDEEDYAAQFDAALISAGFPATLGFLIDTSRNGWGGPTRPTGPSTSTVLNTFVDATKIDQRDDMGQWCNQQNQGLGVPPTVSPGFFTNLYAYVWIKPPGESDGNYPGSVFNGVTSTTGDPNCDPAHSNALANSMLTGAIRNSPPAGTFWTTEFQTLVQNAFPAIPATTAPGFTVTAPGATVEQGTSATDSVTVASINGFSSAINLSISGLPAGVTATFNPATVTGTAGTTLTFVATNTATVGAATVTITGSSGATTTTTTLTLNVTAEPNFTISASPAAVSVPAATSGSTSISIGYVGGLTGSVSLSASNLPAGVSANFSPNSVNSTGTVSVSFFVQSGTAAGTSNVTITGTDGTISHSVTVALTIPGTASPSFTIAPASSALTLTPGSSTADTVTVAGSGGFAGSVTLAVSGLPTGVTASFGTNPTTGSSVLTLTAGSTAAPGTANLKITGTSGALLASSNISLTVTATQSPNFTLSASSPTLSVTQGSAITETVTVIDTGGFAGSVTLTASGLPSGVGAVFSTNPTTGSSVLTLTASSTASAGTANVIITGTSGTLTATASVALSVNPVVTAGFACHVDYTVNSQWAGGFGAALTINNTGTTAISNWTLTWTFADGQTVSQLWNGIETQSGGNVSVTNESYNGSIASGGSYSGMGFNGTWNNATNATPASFAVNGVTCQ
jgi:cellulose 1,4-beta-cellobiosidase